MILAIEILAKLGTAGHDSVTAMAGIAAVVVLFAYWILKA